MISQRLNEIAAGPSDRGTRMEIPDGKNLEARTGIRINAPLEKVWDALVNPDLISRYMLGTQVKSEWREGSPIIWKGEWQGKEYEDKGTIILLKVNKLLKYSHFSPMGGKKDSPENYHMVTVRLSSVSNGTDVLLLQDNNESEEVKTHSEKIWKSVLENMKKLLEAG